MDIQNILNLINAVSQSPINNLELEDHGFKIKLSKDSNVVVKTQVNAIEEPRVIVEEQQLVVQEKTVTSVGVEAKSDENCKEVKSPMVGTLYVAPSPDSPAFVKVGDRVKKGQVVCIVEAMKLMNEIECDYDGEVVEILVSDEQMVEFGQALFKIRP